LPYPTLRQILLLSFLVFPVAQFLIYPVVGEDAPRLGMVAAELFLLWLAAFMVRLRRWNTEDVFLLNAAPTCALGGSLVAALGAALLASDFDHVCAWVLQALAWDPPLTFVYMQLQIQLITDLSSALAVVLAVIIVPALCEEVFFRGLVFTGLRYQFGPTAAIVGSALLFAAAHFNPWQFPALFLLGLFLAALVHWTHSLYPALIAHATNNALSVAAVNLRAHTGMDMLGATDALPWPMLLGAVAALLWGIRWLRQQAPIMPILSPYARPAPADGPRRPGG
jgi:membrane protease YdiL (CAAX protease family)